MITDPVIMITFRLHLDYFSSFFITFSSKECNRLHYDYM